MLLLLPRVSKLVRLICNYDHASGLIDIASDDEIASGAMYIDYGYGVQHESDRNNMCMGYRTEMRRFRMREDREWVDGVRHNDR